MAGWAGAGWRWLLAWYPQIMMTKIIAGRWLGWLDRLAALYPQRIVTEIIDGPIGAGWHWLPAWYLQIILTKIIAGVGLAGWAGWPLGILKG